MNSGPEINPTSDLPLRNLAGGGLENNLDGRKQRERGGRRRGRGRETLLCWDSSSHERQRYGVTLESRSDGLRRKSDPPPETFHQS